ncbi:LysR family transcriptional regulator [Shewanella sp. NFH-SH190041]|uniref:LysR family transcriptional regulator n=1 Tax=Shewanella sp. NFH-SH190041 TaxID=2950245 RepID=UPI0021C31967|nr:LysR family transcriptional regulator [Shewanella sp. NFH-SH190041]BDM65754.1 LysR family transcriptional regulator [Shewanella sp. NFH-SH190041]
MNIPIKTLHCFITLVETGNYTRAAEKLYLTQPTLSKMIQRLEEQLGQQLLLRNNQKITLTQAGTLFETSARQMLGQWHRLEQDMHDLSGVKSGVLRLGVCPMMSSLFIGLLMEYRRRYPGITLEMHEYGGFGCERALIHDTLDIAFTALPTVHDDELAHEPLSRYPLMACLPNQHQLISKPELCWADFADHPFILYNEDFSLAKIISRLSNDAGVKLNIAFRSGQWDFLASMVEAEMGLALLPEPICRKLDSSELTFRPMNPPLTWDLGLIWRRNLPLTPAAKALLELTQELNASHESNT